MGGYPFGTPYARIASGAAAVYGSHNRIRRVRAINFGSQEPGRECFPLAVGPLFEECVNSVIDECILERPSPDNVRETTCISAHGHQGEHPLAYLRACGIRNCVLDGRHEGGAHSLQIAIVAFTKVTDTDPATGNPYTHRYRITTLYPHGRTLANCRTITIFRIEYVVGSLSFSSNAFSGTFPINATTNTTMDFTVPVNPEDLSPAEPAFSSGSYNAFAALINAFFQGPTAEGCTTGFVSNNRVYHVVLANNHDTWSTKDTVYRENYYANVAAGHFQALGSEDLFPKTIASLSRTSNLATLITTSPHQLITGQAVHVRFVFVSGVLDLGFAGYFEIKVLNATTFTYASVGPDAVADTSSPGGFLPREWKEFYRIRNFAVERNIIETARSVRYDQASVGIRALGGPEGSPEFRSIRRLIIRDNLLRHFEDTPNVADRGIVVGQCEKGIVRDNFVFLQGDEQGYPFLLMAGDYLDRVRYMNNHRASGERVFPWDQTKQRYKDELVTTIADSQLSAL